MNWGPEDFAAAGVILSVAAAAVWLAMRQSTRITYLTAFAAGLGGVFLLVWVSLAVGIIGDEGNPANLIFAAVVAVAIAGAAFSQLEPGGLSKAMAVTAAAQALAGTAAVILIARLPGAPGLPVVTAFNAVLVLAFGLSAWLFRIEDGRRRLS